MEWKLIKNEYHDSACTYFKGSGEEEEKRIEEELHFITDQELIMSDLRGYYHPDRHFILVDGNNCLHVRVWELIK